MSKYLVTVEFEWNEKALQAVSGHREYINSLIEQLVIDHYALSMEVQTLWITINAKSKTEVKQILSKSPFKKFWKLNVHKLTVWDGQNYRLPAMQLN